MVEDSCMKLRHLSVAAMLAVTASAVVAPASASTEQQHHRRAGTPYTFVSMPDFLNADIGDVSGRPGWEPRFGNGINDAYRTALDVVLSDVAAEHADDFLMAGDMVEGHWGRDDQGTKIFGPTSSGPERTNALRAAADTYYPQMKRLFARYGLDPHAAVGDHDIGDNPWQPKANDPERSGWYSWKRDQMHVFKNKWASYFTDDGTRYASHPPAGTPADETAYSVQLAPEVLLVTVDEFRRTSDNVVFELDGPQMTWLRGVLSRARANGIGWVIVQGHNPVLGPVRSRHSSDGQYVDGSSSEFWRVLDEFNVDLYLAGEVHDTTMRTRDDIVQISHGGLFVHGESMYLTASVSDGQMTIAAKEWKATQEPIDPPLWSTDTRKQLNKNPIYEPGPVTVGTAQLGRAGQIYYRTGALAPYNP